jgi:hypothetical protein
MAFINQKKPSRHRVLSGFWETLSIFACKTSERRDNKLFALTFTVLALSFCVVLVLLLKERPDLLEKILCAVGGIVAGAFGGYGIGRHRGVSGE